MNINLIPVHSALVTINKKGQLSWQVDGNENDNVVVTSLGDLIALCKKAKVVKKSGAIDEPELYTKDKCALNLVEALKCLVNLS